MPELRLSDDESLFYDCFGREGNPPVVLLHGFTSTGRMWGAQIDALVHAGYLAVVPDMRGHGRSSAPEGLDRYGIARYALDVRELLQSIETEICALVGCSFGGMVALEYAVTFPETLAALVISDASPAYERPDYDDRFRERERGMRENEEVVRKFGAAALGKRLARDIADPFLADGIRERYARLSSDGFLGAAHTRRERRDVTGLLGERLTMPVLLCDGDADPVFCALDVMAQQLPAARVRVFKGAGHGLPSTRPEPFTHELVDFLRTVEDGAPVEGRRIVPA
ncbi:MAG: alpha/beta fold hydrolase [Dehalococcoidia bacterium]